MGYEGIRALVSFVYEDVKLIFKSIVKANVFSMCKREKIGLVNLLHSIPGRMSLTSDMWTSVATEA